jgi:nucleotide-binding universal stress UspA family protein
MTDGEQKRFNILVCIDGSEESHRGLRYALRFSLDHDDTDITLLYVRPEDKGLSTGGLNVSVARENMADWDIEMPSLTALKRARSILVDNGFLGEEWDNDEINKKTRGSRTGDHMISYTSKKTGQHITLMVRISDNVLVGILDEARFNAYDLVIISSSDDGSGGAGRIDLATANTLAMEHDGTVIVAHSLEQGHGHLVCLTDMEEGLKTVRRDIKIASRCGCPVHILTVVGSQDEKSEALRSLEQIKSEVERDGFGISSIDVKVGDPVSWIMDKGKEHSLVVLSETKKSTMRRLFAGSVSYDLLKKAKNSVMIIR